MVDYTTDFEEKDWEREKIFLYVFTSPAALQHREREREREKFCVRKKNFKIFEVCHNEWMRGEHISFYVVFVGAVYWEIITMMVDYTQILKKKDCERKKEKCMFSPLHHSSAAHHRER